MEKNVLKDLGRALDNIANIATADASENFKAVLSILPEVITFFLKLVKFKSRNGLDFMPTKRNKRHKNYIYLHHLKTLSQNKD